MKVLILGDINSAHIQKWVSALSLNKIEIGIFSLSIIDNNWVATYKNVQILNSGLIKRERYLSKGSLFKVAYFKSLPLLKEAIKTFNPDIVHAHYATSYGLLGILSGFHPIVVSVWGSDVFQFPRKSIFHEMLFRYILKYADKILSTSNIMKNEILKYVKSEVQVIPFGINTDIFKPGLGKNELFDRDSIVIGTIKSLEKHYGIEYLIKAFKRLVEKYPHEKLKLLLVGSGSQENELKKMVRVLDINDLVTFTGAVKYEEIPGHQNALTISVTLSPNESFGVSTLEASACEKPVVVSQTGGLAEIVENDKTGFTVPFDNVDAIVDKLSILIEKPELRTKLGKAGRERVLKYYDLKNNTKDMIKIYNSVLTQV